YRCGSGPFHGRGGRALHLRGCGALHLRGPRAYHRRRGALLDRRRARRPLALHRRGVDARFGARLDLVAIGRTRSRRTECRRRRRGGASHLVARAALTVPVAVAPPSVAVGIAPATVAIAIARASVVVHPAAIPVVPPAVATAVMAVVIPGAVMAVVDVAARPIERAEPEAAADRDAIAPAQAAVTEGIRIAGPRIPVHRRRVGPPPIPVGIARVVVRDVHRFRRGGFDHVVVAAAIDPHVAARLQRARGIGARAQLLYGIHDLARLADEGGSEILGPLRPVGHHREDLREGRERHDARIPGRVLDGTDC